MITAACIYLYRDTVRGCVHWLADLERADGTVFTHVKASRLEALAVLAAHGCYIVPETSPENVLGGVR